MLRYDASTFDEGDELDAMLLSENQDYEDARVFETQLNSRYSDYQPYNEMTNIPPDDNDFSYIGEAAEDYINSSNDILNSMGDGDLIDIVESY